MKRLAIAIVVVLGIGVFACAAPTLPLPPPAASGSPALNGTSDVRGTAAPGALVVILNVNLGAGIIVTAGPDGVFAARVYAASGNRVEVWQELGTDRSPSTPFDIP